MDTKGIEVRGVCRRFGAHRGHRSQTVRRDNCRLVVTVIETCLKKMLIERDVKGAEESVFLGTRVEKY
jgi:hypothetical protein